MHIAFITFTGLRSEGSWPATAASMAKALERAGHRVTRISPQAISKPNYWRARKALYMLVGQRFQTERHESVIRELCDSVSRQLECLRPDLVLASSSLVIPYLRTNIPLAFWTDATFGGMIGFYLEFNRLSKGTVRSGMALEARALERADMAFYASEWAARSAVEIHGADPAKVHVVPFGPNLDDPPTAEQVTLAIAGRKRDVCRSLYIGYDWERKQGDLAVGIHRELLSKGVPSQLVIIGCDPQINGSMQGIEKLGLLDKSNPEDLARINDRFTGSHFLVVPSKAECYGMVYAEASAHGLPSVALDLGGVPTVVRHGVNGHLFKADATASTIADHIAQTWRDEDAYRALAQSTRRFYEEELAWDRCIDRLNAIVADQLVGRG